MAMADEMPMYSWQHLCIDCWLYAEDDKLCCVRWSGIKRNAGIPDCKADSSAYFWNWLEKWRRKKTERTGTASTKSYSLIAATANEKIVQTPSAQFESHGLNPHYSEKQIVASFFMEVWISSKRLSVWICLMIFCKILYEPCWIVKISQVVLFLNITVLCSKGIACGKIL